MKIMSFNILYGGAGERNWTLRKELVRNVIKSHDPWVFGLQEAHHDWMTYLRSELSDYDCVGVGRDDGKTKGEYSPVFYKKSKFTLEDSGSFWLSETPEKPGKGWDAACTRICSYALLRDRERGTVGAFFNTHLDHVGSVAQREGARLIAQRAGSMFPGVPTVVTGDFNVLPMWDAYKAILSAGFRDAATEVCNPRSEGTFHDFGKCREVIDYIFVKNGAEATSYLTDTEKAEDKFPSDHYAIIAEIEY